MKSRLVRSEQLSPTEREAMYSLLSTHFEGVTQEVFDSDLTQKNWTILLEDEAGKVLKGFSTILIYKTQFAGEDLIAVYSGDTIIDPSAWSSSSLSRTWMSAIAMLRLEYPQGRFYWLLISSGYRTYRFLPTFAKEFYPRYETPTPTATQVILDFLSDRLFGKYYDKETGIVRFPYPQVLREGLKEIPEERLNNPHVRFFLLKNPGHVKGDELVCLAEISENNLTEAGRRMWSRNINLASC